MEKEFVFQCPTKIYFRTGGVSTIGAIISRDYHFNRVFLIYGSGSIKQNGIYQKVISSLDDNRIEHDEYSGIGPNPDIEDVRNIIVLLKKGDYDLLLAIGGGSVIDAAKSAAHGYYYQGDPLDFNKKVVQPLHALPVATILTLAASGSEMSSSCVISDRKHHFKGGFNSLTNYPLFSLLDPELLKTVPLYQRGIGIADMFSHALERYLSPSSSVEPSDGVALGVMKSIVKVTQKVIEQPDDIEALSGLLMCGTLAHNGMANYGKEKVFRIHQLEHYLSGKYPWLAHGQGIALIMKEYLTVNRLYFKEKIKEMGRVVFNLYDNCLSASLTMFYSWLSFLPIYHTFEELPQKIDDKDLEKLRKKMRIKSEVK